MKKLFGLIATGLLAFGASTASAIPIQVEVGTIGGSSGSWILSGPSIEGGSWFHLFAGEDSWDGNISPGDYLWQIQGSGAGLLGWSLSIGGSTIFSGYEIGIFKNFEVRDDYTVVAVPESGALGLLGFGLLALGFASTRRRKAAV